MFHVEHLTKEGEGGSYRAWQVCLILHSPKWPHPKVLNMWEASRQRKTRLYALTNHRTKYRYGTTKPRSGKLFIMPTKKPHKPQRARNKRPTKEILEAQMLGLTRDAIVNAGGNLAEAAKALDINRRTIYKRLEKYQGLVEELTDVRESTLDLAESKLMAAVTKGEPWAICFKLKCHGKGRGYIERQEITGKDGQPLNASLKAEEKTDAELLIIASGEDPGTDTATRH